MATKKDDAYLTKGQSGSMKEERVKKNILTESLKTSHQKFDPTRPKPPYGRQGLAGSWSKDTVGRVHFKVFSTSNFATHSSVFLELNFAFLQHIQSTLRLNGTPLIQKMSRHEHGAPTDLHD